MLPEQTIGRGQEGARVNVADADLTVVAIDGPVGEECVEKRAQLLRNVLHEVTIRPLHREEVRDKDIEPRSCLRGILGPRETRYRDHRRQRHHHGTRGRTEHAPRLRLGCRGPEDRFATGVPGAEAL